VTKKERFYGIDTRLVRLRDDVLTLFDGVKNIRSDSVLARLDSFSGLDPVRWDLVPKSTGKVLDSALEKIGEMCCQFQPPGASCVWSGKSH